MNVRDAIREASEAADTAPPERREAAFAAVLEHLLRSRTRPEMTVSDAMKISSLGGPGRSQTDGSVSPDELHTLVKTEGNRSQQAVWAVLTLHGEGEEATSEAIVRMIRERLAIAPQSIANTTRTLREVTPKYVMRRERSDGRGYVYEPTGRAADIFRDLLADQPSE